MARKQDLTKVRIDYDEANAKFTKTVADYQADPDDALLEKRYRKAKNDLAVARRTYKIHREQIRGDSGGDGVAEPEAIGVKAPTK
jgi:hypothetical protein